jgi:formylglycine-generating enzyme required for sulfatase activity/CheY-like chemotaxis protein
MMTVANPLLEAEEAKTIVDRFVRRFDESYRLLVYHAAIPLILTPELLNYLRHQFLRGQVDWVAEVDLLLSDLFNPVGYELYAMDTAVRAYLLENIEEFFRKKGFEEKHLQKVALVLLGYIKYLAHSNSFFGAPELQAQQWAAMVYIEEQKEKVYQDIKQAFKTCVSEAELARLTQITQELSPQLSSYTSLIKFAESVRDLLLDLKPGLTEFELLTTRENVAQLSKDLEIDLSKFPELGIIKVPSLGINQILLVEDDPEVIEEISKVLSSQYGIAVRGTDEVNEVIKLAASSQIDLMLINHKLPNSRYQGTNVDGLEIIRILRSNPNISSSLPIVGFSKSTRYLADAFLESGANGYYSKQELLDGGNYQKFVDYLQEIFNRVTQPPKPGKHYAIAIGINQYQHFPNKTNQYALRDAQVMKDWFSQSGFTEVHSLSEANSGAFQSFLSSHFQPSSLTPTDTLWCYFSGLGVTVGERDYLLFSDSNLDDLEKTAISVGDLSKRLLQSGVGRLILLLDADRWGQWQYGKQRETLPPASALAQALRSQSGIDPRKQGLLVFYACLPDEGAYEIDLFQQGLFTYAFREAVRHGRGGDISAQKLYQSLRDRAIKLAQEYVVRASQTPELVAEPDSLREQILPLAPTFPFNLESFSVEVATIVFEEELPKLEFETLFVNKRGEIIRRQQCEAYYYDQPLEVESSVPSEGGARGGLKSGESKFQNSLRMIYIPEGTFWMGSPEGEKDRSYNESPQHKVTVSPFFMSQTPITKAQWRFVAHLPQEQRELNPNPSSNGDEHPVVNVSWYDALEFCARLSLYTERNYRLPSEAEWEHACRAVNLGNPPVVAPTLAEWNEKYNQPFHFGETITSKLANYNGSVIYKQEPKGEYRSQTTPVRTFKPNAFGLYDLHGNVWEWCLDPWHNNYEGAPSDGRVWDEGKEELYEDVLTNLNILLQDTRTHVLRGGSWSYNPRYCRSAFRYGGDPRSGGDLFGFRVLCVPPRSP